MDLIIGYGNTLRGDDAVGIDIAQEVINWQIEKIEVLTCAQLTLDLAEKLAQFARVIFIDASIELSTGATIEKISKADYVEGFTHHCNINCLISLAQCLYERSPQVWLIKVAALDFSLGAPLSPVTMQAKAQAINILKCFFRELCMN
jgi:hydrogenase maturation protease